MKIYLKGVRLEDVDWIYLAQDKNQFQGLVNLVLNTWAA
jgi:hypothetical protein